MLVGLLMVLVMNPAVAGPLMSWPGLAKFG
jgi:hypothetical protein